MGKHIANILTGCRILCSISLLFFPVFSSAFYFLYLFCGFTDMADGYIARKTGSVSEFGANLDSVADLIFIVIASIKILPAIQIGDWIWLLIFIILIIKSGNIVLGLVFRKKLVFLHTVPNKITGLLLFLFPLTLSFIPLQYSVVVVCLAALISAIHEGYYVKVGH